MLDRTEKTILESLADNRLDELSVKDLKGDSDKGTVSRSKKLKSKFKEIKIRPFRVVFKTKSGTPGTGRVWTQTIALPELDDIRKDESLSPKEKVRLGLAGDVNVTCNCPAFKYYGFEYVNTQLESVLGKGNNIFPKERNPDLEGSLCKHLHHVLTTIPFFTNDIAGKLKALKK